MAAKSRAEALEPRGPPSQPEASEPRVLSEAADADAPGSEFGHRESATPRQSADSRREAIARSAYFLAEARSFEPGHELDDWLAAEQQASQG